MLMTLLVFGCLMNNVDLSVSSASYELGPAEKPPTAYSTDEFVDIYWTISYKDEKYDRYEVKVIDPNGETVVDETMPPGYSNPIEGNYQWNPSDHPDGIYTVSLTTYTVDEESPETITKEFRISKIRGNLEIIKFDDIDASGDRSSEPGLSGWKFEISGPEKKSETYVMRTNGEGVIFLRDIPAGNYTVRELVEEPPTSGPWHSTTPIEQSPVIKEGETTTVHFGNVEYSNLIINKYDDSNDNVRLDSTDPLLPGVEFTIDGPSGVLTRTTDSNGRIQINDVPPGTYSVRETQREGWRWEPLDEVRFTLSSGETKVLNLLNIRRKLPVLEIAKFEDENRNGSLDPGESGIQGWTFDIESAGRRYTDTTGMDGRISINIPPGTYTVKEGEKAGWSSTTQTEQVVTLNYGDVKKLNFGNTRNRLEIVAFEDRNDNGRRDSGEAGLPNGRFSINGETKATNVNGIIEYFYDDAGTYVVTETLMGDLWYNTTPLTQSASLDKGDMRLEFGNGRYRDLIIRKFDDENENKIRDSTEIGLSGWEFYVEGPDGNVATYQTDGDGEVSAKVRSSRAYTVSENTIVGWRNTTHSAQRVTIGPDDNEVELNFGNTRIPLTINIHKFNDLNNDSIQNDGERDAMPGWNFTITDPEGKTHRVTTNDNSLAVFTSKVAGRYIITEEDQTGWISSTPRSIRTRYLWNGGESSFYFGNVRYCPSCCDCDKIYDPKESPWKASDENVEVIKSINPDALSFDDFDENNGAVINYTIELRAKPKMAPADLVIAADTSTSISPLTLTDISNSIAGFAEGSRAYTDLRVGLVSWDDNVDEEGTVGITTDRDAVIEAAGELRARPYEITFYQVGLEGSLSKFSESPRDARKMIVFITDSSGECWPFTDLSGLDPEDYAINVISVSPVQANETKCMLENVTRDFNGELIIVDDPSKIEAELLRLSRENLAESQLKDVHLVDSLPGYLHPCDYTVNPPDEVRGNADGQWETTTLEWDIGTISPNWSTSFEAIFCWRVPADVSQPEGVARVASEVTYADPKTGDEKRVLIPEGGIRIGPTERSRTAESAPSNSENGGIPGFSILASMTGLAAAAYLFKRD